ncbi:MAG: hypothetical protein WD889_00235 [Candidatus Colwellbacteria bacterium]
MFFERKESKVFGRRKKVVVAPLLPEIVIFGSVRVPEGRSRFEHEGYQIRDARTARIGVSGSCRQCGTRIGPMNYAEPLEWEEVKQLASLCGDCKWLESEYEGDLAKTIGQIEELEAKHEILLTALVALPGVKRPESLSWDNLEDAGLILHRAGRAGSNAVLGFILIDYSRQEMHRLVQAVDGQLEPFSRGFKLFLGTEYYKLFPGSCWWPKELYSYFDHRTYFDFLREHQEKVETRAEEIKGRIEAFVVT